jgi:hypothetical protein
MGNSTIESQLQLTEGDEEEEETDDEGNIELYKSVVDYAEEIEMGSSTIESQLQPPHEGDEKEQNKKGFVRGVLYQNLKINSNKDVSF